MTERGLTNADGSPACPFVAFEDDRDARADRPDHRHRCFADVEPAPRAVAHQEAYCLSSAFPVCPVFQDWARREAARARPDASSSSGSSAPASSPAAGTPGSAGAGAAVVSAAGGTAHADAQADEWSGAPPTDPPVEGTPRRNPPRDWAAPPPWATGAGASAGGSWSDPAASDYRPAKASEGAGLAGSAADRLASGGSISEPPPAGPSAVPARPSDVPSSGPDAELAGLVGAAAAAAAAAPGSSSADQRLAAERAAQRAADEAAYDRSTGAPYPPPSRTGRRPSVSSTRSAAAGPAQARPRTPDREHVQHDGPSWEKARRYEAYPQIKLRSGIPALPRVAVLGAALGVAALILFFLPALLGVGGGDSEPSASPTPSFAELTPTPEPTPEPEPTPQMYTIKEGDTLSRIAKEFGVTLDQLLEANKDTIENPNRISVGDEIIIPIPPPDEVVASEEPAP